MTVGTRIRTGVVKRWSRIEEAPDGCDNLQEKLDMSISANPTPIRKIDDLRITSLFHSSITSAESISVPGCEVVLHFAWPHIGH